jgi:hypothetical protein
MLKVLRLIFTFMLVLTAAGVNAQVTTSAISINVKISLNTFNIIVFNWFLKMLYFRKHWQR